MSIVYLAILLIAFAEGHNFDDRWATSREAKKKKKVCVCVFTKTQILSLLCRLVPLSIYTLSGTYIDRGTYMGTYVAAYI
jgi:hypothetical protein